MSAFLLYDVAAVCCSGMILGCCCQPLAATCPPWPVVALMQ
jgi:hypothetical protein